jgi:hypothetical protein
LHPATAGIAPAVAPVLGRQRYFRYERLAHSSFQPPGISGKACKINLNAPPEASRGATFYWETQMSEKTVADKMFLRNAKSMLILNGKVHPGVVAQMPAGLLKDEHDQEPVDVVLLFAMNRKELEELFPRAKERLGEKGSLWIAYLKQTASKATDINRDSIHDYVQDNGITAVAMISIDGDWSALRCKRIAV